MSQTSKSASATPSVLTRRRVFAGAGGAGALAAVAVLLPTAPVDATAVAAKPAEPEGEGYRLTEHIKRYYQTARV